MNSPPINQAGMDVRVARKTITMTSPATAADMNAASPSLHARLYGIGRRSIRSARHHQYRSAESIIPIIVKMNVTISAGLTTEADVLYIGRLMLYISSAMSRLIVAIFLGLAAGCVQRQMSIQSDPPGALVYLNGREVGRTPLEHDFLWYGTYDVQVRQEGYETLKTRTPVIAPWWQWPPFDLFAELFPLTDRRSLHYTLTPAADTAIDFDAIMARASVMQADLQGSQVPTTQPAAAEPPAVD